MTPPDLLIGKKTNFTQIHDAMFLNDCLSMERFITRIIPNTDYWNAFRLAKSNKVFPVKFVTIHDCVNPILGNRLPGKLPVGAFCTLQKEAM